MKSKNNWVFANSKIDGFLLKLTLIAINGHDMISNQNEYCLKDLNLESFWIQRELNSNISNIFNLSELILGIENTSICYSDEYIILNP